MIFNVHRINLEEISDLKTKKNSSIAIFKVFILSCEHGHLKKMIIWEDEPNPNLLSVQNIVLFRKGVLRQQVWFLITRKISRLE